jgi:phosphoesterase RecJ-like protein
MEEKLRQLINQSSKILIISHVSPDPDSISSTLLLGLTLESNFPDKQIIMNSEELPDNLSFLPGFKNIQNKKLEDAINDIGLIIIVDAMNFGRCTRGDHQALSQKVKEENITVAIIDHHEAVGVEDNAAYINQGYPAAVEQAYETLFNQLGLKKPAGYAEITMAGLYADTGGFTYLNGRYKETLTLIGELLDAGTKIEDIKNKLYQYSKRQLKVVAELATNTSHKDDYTYTFLSDEFVKDWANSGQPLTSMHTATKIFTDNFIRNIEGRKWGFIIYRDYRLGENIYSISLRSVGGTPDVTTIAVKMDGGGHKAASGARIQASNINEAIEKVHKIISETI